MLTPAHLCQFISLSLLGENGRPSAYRPTQNTHTMATAKTQWKALAVPVYRAATVVVVVASTAVSFLAPRPLAKVTVESVKDASALGMKQLHRTIQFI